MSGIRSRLRELARARTPFTMPVQVTAIQQPAPGFLRVQVTGDLDDYTDPRPADAFKLFLPTPGSDRPDPPQRDERGLPFWPPGTQRPQLRAFTVSEVDVAAGRLAFDVAVHADGLAIRWLRTEPVGHDVSVSGMRGDFAAGDDIEHHVFVGDSSSLPAIAAALADVRPAPATVWLSGVDPGGLDLLPRWEGLNLHAVAGTFDPPQAPLECRLQVWVAGEAGLVQGVRAHAAQVWGVDRDDLHASAYWRRQHDNTAFDAANLRGYEAALARGGDVMDPDLREEVELGVAGS